MTRRVKLSLPAGLITPKSTVLPGLPPAQPGSAETAHETTSATAPATATESLAPIASALGIDWQTPPSWFRWTYHPIVTKPGPHSFASFWKTDPGKALVMR